jgi:hypothetical protein
MGGIKFDSEKPRWDLLPLDLLEPVVRVLTMGARKYSAENWKAVPEAPKRYYSALMRHLSAWQAGEKIDPESGETHLSHAICNLVFLEWFDREEK